MQFIQLHRFTETSYRSTDTVSDPTSFRIWVSRTTFVVDEQNGNLFLFVCKFDTNILFWSLVKAVIGMDSWSKPLVKRGKADCALPILGLCLMVARLSLSTCLRCCKSKNASMPLFAK